MDGYVSLDEQEKRLEKTQKVLDKVGKVVKVAVLASVAALGFVGLVAVFSKIDNAIHPQDPEKFLEDSIYEIRAQLADAEFELQALRENK